MLKTTCKQAKENIRNYIIEGFEPYDTDEINTETATFKEKAKYILKTAESEKYHPCIPFSQSVFIDWCRGLPSIIDTNYYYHCTAVEILGNILEETEEEKAKYTEEQAEDWLTWLIYRELTNAIRK